jgi:hypothetical protein
MKQKAPAPSESASSIKTPRMGSRERGSFLSAASMDFASKRLPSKSIVGSDQAE